MESSTRSLWIAVIDRIIPADEFPSASEAGVMNYLDRQLAGDARKVATIIETGLAVLETTSRNAFGCAFVDATTDRQDALLSDVENEPFFLRLVELTSEGFYADPGNGGNLNAVSWKMIGFDPNGQDEGAANDRHL